MKVFYSKGKHVIVYFPAKELKQALGVLKALATHFRADFLWKASKDLEDDLTPKLSFEQCTRICTNCFTEVDLRGSNCLYVDNSYMHKSCPELRQDRPI